MESAFFFRTENTSLPCNPKDSIAYMFKQLRHHNVVKQKPILIVFVNGLGLPQTFWQQSIQLLKQRLMSTSGPSVSCFTYDRRGQGLSRRSDGSQPEPHDIMSSVQELHEIINHINLTNNLSTVNPEIFIVAHSIGVPLSRLYCRHYPGKITALLALDSNMANTDFTSLMPNPDSPTFNATLDLPSDTTVPQLQWTRENYTRLFHPSTPNPENLDRSNLASLLPLANSPILYGPNSNKSVLLTVVGHDPDTFAEESLKISTRGLTDRYMQPAWEVYNRRLRGIGRVNKGVVVAVGSGHFIQRDNPGCVVDEVVEMVERIVEDHGVDL